MGLLNFFPGIDILFMHTRPHSIATAITMALFRQYYHLHPFLLPFIQKLTKTRSYWDWTLDWEDLRSAPIWSPTLGFGGDGDLNSPETVGHGRCVTDGAFAHLKPLFYASHYQPHCLSRGFSEFSGRDARPEAVEEIMKQNEYEKFFLAVENGPHNVVPVGVRGDFYSFTAPYGLSAGLILKLTGLMCSPADPVFFLHHAQLDRLWWLWQQRDIPRRLSEYHGRASTNGTIGATLQDVLTLKGLMSDISVSDIMDTEGGYLCYRY